MNPHFFIPLRHLELMKVKVEKIAKELLLEEDFVVIPEFGGFVTSYRSAVIEPSKNILLPPSKLISFNAKLSKNDGLLAKSISEKLGVSYKDALDSIQVRVNFWKKELETKHYLEFEDLGSFILNKEGGLVFEQFNEANFLDSSFGLTNVHAIPVERVGFTQKIERGLSNQQAKPRSLKMLYGATAAAVLMFGVFTASWQYKTGGLDNALGFFSFGKSVPVTQEQPQVIAGQSISETSNEVEVKPESTTLDRLITQEEPMVADEVTSEVLSVEVEVAPVEEEVLVEDVVEEKVIEVHTALKYHVIAGCFGVENNATKMLKQLKKKGYDARLAGKSRSGLFRVAYGSYGTKVEALKALDEAKVSHNQNAWLAKD